MCTAYQVQVVLLIEVLYDDFAEGVGHAAIVLAPVDYVLFRISRIRPQQITEQSTIWDICRAQNFVNLLKVIEFG